MYLGVLAATSANVDATKSIILQGTNQAAREPKGSIQSCYRKAIIIADQRFNGRSRNITATAAASPHIALAVMVRPHDGVEVACR